MDSSSQIMSDTALAPWSQFRVVS